MAKVRFQSKVANLDLVINPGKTRLVKDDKTGREVVITEPLEQVTFRNNVFETEDERLIEILRNDPRKGKLYWEIEPMDIRKVIEQKRKELEELEKQIEAENEETIEAAEEEFKEQAKQLEKEKENNKTQKRKTFRHTEEYLKKKREEIARKSEK